MVSFLYLILRNENKHVKLIFEWTIKKIQRNNFKFIIKIVKYFFIAFLIFNVISGNNL